MDFYNRIGTITKDSLFSMEGYHVWCGSVTKHNEKYYLLFSRWPSALGFKAWVSHSQVCWAVSKNVCGPYTFGGVALAGSGRGWDADSIHNPTVMKHADMYYMYYMGTHGKEDWNEYRLNQRIGVAVASSPEGPWIRSEKPAIDVSKESWDSILTSNPSVTQGKDKKFYMMYKGVSLGKTQKADRLLVGMAIAEKPDGPFVKTHVPCFENPEQDLAVEDPFIWLEKDTYYAIMKDFQGYFSKGEKGSAALFESKDGLKWTVSDHPLALKKELKWGNKPVQKVNRLERPQLFIENGTIKAISCACMVDDNTASCNVQIPVLDMESR